MTQVRSTVVEFVRRVAEASGVYVDLPPSATAESSRADVTSQALFRVWLLHFGAAVLSGNRLRLANAADAVASMPLAEANGERVLLEGRQRVWMGHQL